MVNLSIRIRHGEDPIHVSTPTELDQAIQSAADEASALSKLNFIFLDAPNGNELRLIVGGAETVLSFAYSYRNAPYYASRGASESSHPVITCFVGLAHYTEFPRRYVVPYATGLTAAHEFAETTSLPNSLRWIAL